jgi:hypothetical protein
VFLLPLSLFSHLSVIVQHCCSSWESKGSLLLASRVTHSHCLDTMVFLLFLSPFSHLSVIVQCCHSSWELKGSLLLAQTKPTQVFLTSCYLCLMVEMYQLCGTTLSHSLVFMLFVLLDRSRHGVFWALVTLLKGNSAPCCWTHLSLIVTCITIVLWLKSLSSSTTSCRPCRQLRLIIYLAT